MVAPKPQDVLQLAQEITQLEAQLAAARRKWDVLFGVVAPEKKTHIRREDGLTARCMLISQVNGRLLRLRRRLRSNKLAAGSCEHRSFANARWNVFAPNTIAA